MGISKDHATYFVGGGGLDGIKRGRKRGAQPILQHVLHAGTGRGHGHRCRGSFFRRIVGAVAGAGGGVVFGVVVVAFCLFFGIFSQFFFL